MAVHDAVVVRDQSANQRRTIPQLVFAGDSLPAWPVVALIGGLPVWYALGLLPFVHLPFAVIMGAMLFMRGAARLVPGILPWFAFVAWTMVCALMLDSPGRLVGYGMRLSQWITVAILMVYVINAARSLPLSRLVSSILVVWATTIAGGFLAIAFGGVAITTPTALVLPQSLLANEYVQDLVIPKLAQVDMPWGVETPFVRPAAPFAYANSWGAALAIMTPIAIAAIAMAERWSVRVLLVVGLAASAVPAIASSNRGMLLALGAAVGYAVLRLALRGSVPALLGMGLLALALVAELYTGVFTDGIMERQGAADTTQGRARLYIETFQRTLLSPVLGWGAPRPSMTLEISVGTQGQFWFVMFSFGFVGLALFLTFLFGATIRTLDVPGNARLWLHASLFAACVLVFYYGIDSTMHLVLGAVAAGLLRDKYLTSPRSRLPQSVQWLRPTEPTPWPRATLAEPTSLALGNRSVRYPSTESKGSHG